MNLMFCFASCVPFFVQGESVVPEQVDEVEEGKIGPAKHCCLRKGNGEREERNPAPFRAVRDRCSHAPANGDSLDKEDSHNSDHSSEHAHL